MSAAILLPRVMRVGGGASEELAEVLNQIGAKNPLLITEEFFVKSGAVAKVIAPLEQANIPYGLFTGIVPDPTTDSINAGISVLKGAALIVSLQLVAAAILTRRKP